MAYTIAIGWSRHIARRIFTNGLNHLYKVWQRAVKHESSVSFSHSYQHEKIILVMSKLSHLLLSKGRQNDLEQVLFILTKYPIEKIIRLSPHGDREVFPDDSFHTPPTPNRAGHFRVTRLSKV